MARDLQPLFSPSSVAVLGASNDPAKWGNWLARGALLGAHRRPVYLVNRNGGRVLGVETYTSLQSLPEAPELVVVAVPAAGFEEAVDSALAKGARAIVGITAGLGEGGGEALARERALVERVRSAGAMLLGPNCLGVFDSSSDLGLASNEFPPGSIGLISQSGNLALELGMLARPYGLGFSRFASIGNQADLDLAELVASYAVHEPTRLIAVYAEDFRDGRAFVDAVASAGKPVLLLTVGRTAASVRAAASHTGALVSDLAVVEAACRAAGAHMVATPGQLIDLAQGLLLARPMAGRRVAVLSDGGGHGAIACDAAAAVGLELPLLSGDLADRLASMLPPTASTVNPVDIAGGGEQDFFSYSRTARGVLESGEVDGLLMTGFFGGYSTYSDEFNERETDVAREIVRAVADTGRPVVAQSMYPATPPSQALREGGVPVYQTIESAAAALAALVERPAPAGAPVAPAADPQPLDAGYHGSRDLLERAGVPFVAARRAGTPGEVQQAADELGFPVVLKGLGMLHKSDAGGVVVGIPDAEALARELAGMQQRLAPPEFSVERMAPLADGVELIVGARRDARFGAVAMVGLGGVFAELFKDVAIGLAPLTADEAERLLRSLRGAALLGPARGREGVDVRAAAEAAAALSRLAAARPDIAEIEINPLLATPSGALALDARIIPATEGGADAG
jgi:acyl-CoA synthetase (NDP forming)